MYRWIVYVDRNRKNASKRFFETISILGELKCMMAAEEELELPTRGI